jgi:Domain of unknown function (DUF1902)
MVQPFKVLAIWDPSLEVFVSESDVPGLVIEAETFEEFVASVEELAPDLLQANMPEAQRPFEFEIVAHWTMEIV